MAILSDLEISPTLNGILFAEDFGDDEASVAQTCSDDGAAAIDEATECDVEVELRFSAAELAAARQEGFNAGRVAGRGDAGAIHQRKVADGVERIAQLFERDDTSSLQLTERSIEGIAQLLISTLIAMLPSVCNRHAAQEVVGTVRKLVACMSHDTLMSVTVATGLHEAVRNALMSLPAHLARRVAVVAVETMPEGDASLEWAQGSASHSARRAREAAVEILSHLQLIVPKSTQQPIVDKQSDIRTLAATAKLGETIDA